MPNPDQGDRDRDQIGDACDPDQVRAGNVPIVFLPNRSATLARWSVAGAWSIANDAFGNADATNGNEEWAYWTQQLSPPIEIQTNVYNERASGAA